MYLAFGGLCKPDSKSDIEVTVLSAHFISTMIQNPPLIKACNSSMIIHDIAQLRCESSIILFFIGIESRRY